MRHDYEAASACTEWFYSTRCWECTGCGNFFTHEDCADEYKKDKDMLYFPPVGHNLKNIPAKDATCVDKGTVEYWHCERCGLNFSDNEGENELTNIETDAPLLPHNYDDNGVCSVCSFKAAAKVLSKDDNDAISHKWYDNIADALTALAEEDAYRIEINKDCDETIALSNAREVYVNKNVTVAKLEATDAEGCVGTGTLGGSNASGGSIRIGAYANATLYSGTLTGNNVSGDGALCPSREAIAALRCTAVRLPATQPPAMAAVFLLTTLGMPARSISTAASFPITALPATITQRSFG